MATKQGSIQLAQKLHVAVATVNGNDFAKQRLSIISTDANNNGITREIFSTVNLYTSHSTYRPDDIRSCPMSVSILFFLILSGYSQG